MKRKRTPEEIFCCGCEKAYLHNEAEFYVRKDGSVLYQCKACQADRDADRYYKSRTTPQLLDAEKALEDQLRRLKHTLSKRATT